MPSGEQSNTSIVFGNHVVIKMFRRAQEGTNPDLEIGQYLTEQAHFPHTAPLYGAIQYSLGKGEPRTIGIANGYVLNEGDAWHYTLDALGLYYEVGATNLPDASLRAPAWSTVLGLIDKEVPAPIAEAIGPYLESCELLGQRTAQLHLALAGGEGEMFTPEPFTTLYQRSIFQSMRAQIRPTLALIRSTSHLLEGEALANAEQVLDAETALLDRFAAIKEHRIEASRIRIHGDFHLGQVLHAGRDFVIIDFEGEPSRSPTERRIKKSGLADVAGMLRSFQYAARAGLMAHADRGLVPHDQWPSFEAREHVWETWAGVRYLAGYLGLAHGTPLVPTDRADLHALLTAYTLDKALYEVRYDLAHRPTWAHIPLHGIVQLLEGAR